MVRLIAFALALTLSVARAADTPASEASIREMLRITEVKKLLDGMFPQIDQMMKASMQEALRGQPVSPDAQKAIDRMSGKITAMMQEEMSWEKLEPLYLTIYKKSFTQEEVDGMLAFYRSPAGVALIKKMPVVMQESMIAMQNQIGPMIQRMQGIIQETVQEITTEQSQQK